jgi:hypothetical protein
MDKQERYRRKQTSAGLVQAVEWIPRERRELFRAVAQALREGVAVAIGKEVASDQAEVKVKAKMSRPRRSDLADAYNNAKTYEEVRTCAGTVYRAALISRDMIPHTSYKTLNGGVGIRLEKVKACYVLKLARSYKKITITFAGTEETSTPKGYRTGPTIAKRMVRAYRKKEMDKLRKIQSANHPDKASNPDLGKFQEATERVKELKKAWGM